MWYSIKQIAIYSISYSLSMEENLIWSVKNDKPIECVFVCIHAWAALMTM